MKSLTKPLALCLVSTGLLLGAQASVAQQQWPDRPVTLVVPFPPGGSTDTTARIVAEGLQDVLKQTVIVENKAGAGGNIGAGYVANAKADGYTYLFATNAHAASVTLYKSLTYDFRKDLTPTAQIVSFPNVLVVKADFPANNLKEFVEYVKTSKDPVNYGSAGNGSSHHLATALLNKQAGGNMQHVPFKGGAPANVALLGGQVQANVAPLAEVMPNVKAGKLRALGVTTAERSDLLPSVPAIGEVLPGYEVTLWSGILAPSGTPKPILQKMNVAVRKVLKDPKVAERLKDLGYNIYDEPLEKLNALYDKEVENWGNMVKISGAQVN
ncbi:MAG: Bug family tripartite tricarboxylate transporter substrate binding protein [Burkholderiaceae bacterium]